MVASRPPWSTASVLMVLAVHGWSIEEATEAETIGLRSETLRDFAIDNVRTGVA